MPVIIEARFDELAFPPCCCGCGSRAFAMRPHTEKVVVWTVISVTKYRQVTLSIPSCDDCARRPWLWFGGAGALAGLAMLYISHASDRGHDVGAGVALFFVAAIAMVLKGQASKALRILGFDSEDRMIKLSIRSAEAARRMLQQHAHHESEHRLVRKPLKIALIVVAIPFVLMFLGALMRHHGT
ncbi:MAG: hypothetical protein ACJ8G1_02420 [Vitreoscilla sp.]